MNSKRHKKQKNKKKKKKEKSLLKELEDIISEAIFCSEDDLNEGQRKVEAWANSVGVKVINMEFINKDPFFNINTKEDLEKAKEKINND